MRLRVLARRYVVLAVAAGQIGLVARGYWSDHKEFAFQMFPESSTWRADVVRVTSSGERVSIREPWAGYTWGDLVRGRGLDAPWVEHHADAGIDNQLAFLDAALDYVAEHTPHDLETERLEATVTYRHNVDRPTTVTLRSVERDVAR
jgi:hypothetical protein